jgi:nitroreductase
MDHLILAAVELGLGTCWIAAFDPVAARKILGLPNDVEPIVFTPLGYANDHPGSKGRKTLTEITLVQNRFSVRVEERLSEVVW